MRERGTVRRRRRRIWVRRRVLYPLFFPNWIFNHDLIEFEL